MDFLTYELLCLFFPWASSALLLTLYSHGFLLTSLGFLGPITSFSSLGFMGLPLTPYFLCLHYFGLVVAHSHFSISYTAHGMLFFYFQASLSPFTSTKPICLFHGPVIHYSCRLGLMVLPHVCQPFATLVTGLSSFYLDSQKWPSTSIFNS